MTDVITLLDLPKTSRGFTALRAVVAPVSFDGSTSPPHKTPRLEGDSDSGSASRSRTHGRESKEGPITLHVVGELRTFSGCRYLSIN
jgi:cullin-4